jgi:uncharacterized cupin superfamily protein
VNRIFALPVAVAVAITVAVAVAALSIEPAAAQESPAPVPMDPEKMAGLNLTPIPNDAYLDILVSGDLQFTLASMFDGEELSVVVVESTPALTDHRDHPTEFDEFVLVLNGKLVLTEPDGTKHEFLPGNAFVVPKGYTGTWEQFGTYRELAVISKQSD